MEGFRQNTKMKSELACYKEGGFVTKKEMKREEKSEDVKDTAKDKQIVKKAFSQHDKQQHEEKTELKLKSGGRSKKEGGNVKRYMKEGGKTECGPDKSKKAAAPSAAAKKGSDKVQKLAMGGAPVAGMPMQAQGTPNLAAGASRGRSRPGTPGYINPAPPAMQAPDQVGQGAAPGMVPPQMPGQGGQTPPMGGMPPGMPPGLAGAPGGMGQASASGGLGQAAPMGPEQDILRGLRAVGSFAAGGCI